LTEVPKRHFRAVNLGLNYDSGPWSNRGRKNDSPDADLNVQCLSSDLSRDSMDSIEKKPGFRRFPSFQIQAITLILLAGFVPAKLAAAEYEITPSNYQQVLPNRTIVAYMGLNCDMGSYAASLFKQSMYDLKGPDLGTININQSSFLRSELPIDLGSIIIIKNGEVIASSEEVKNWLDIAGYTGKRRWVSSTLQKHGITFSGLTLDGPDRMQPDAGPAGGVDLISGLLALYRFNGDLKEETGKNIHLRIDSPVFQIMDDALHGNGEYDMKSNATAYLHKPNLPGKKGFTVAFNFRLEPHEGKPCLNEAFFSVDGGRMDLACHDGTLWLKLEGYEDMTIGDDRYWIDIYTLDQAKFRSNQWHTIVVSLDLSARRGRIAFDGKRLRDFRLDRNYLELTQKSGDYDTFKFTQFRTGSVLKGFVDDFAIWNRPLTGQELLAYHRQYARSGNTTVVDNKPDREELNLALLKAAYKGDATAVSNALDQGAQVDVNFQGWTSLMYAAHFGHADVVEVLIEKGADALIELNGNHAGHIASNQGHTQIAQMIEDYMNTERFYFERSLKEPTVRHRSIPKAPR
tara:strand:+ start:81844 stop:83562 length:1719 start_codon:yes stop_codon:yes gene_type:complete